MDVDDRDPWYDIVKDKRIVGEDGEERVVIPFYAILWMTYGLMFYLLWFVALILCICACRWRADRQHFRALQGGWRLTDFPKDRGGYP